jgi:cytochrome P450
MDASVKSIRDASWVANNEPKKTYEIFSPQTRANPYPIYHQMRRESPLYYDETLDLYFLTRFEDVSAALKDSRLSADRIPNMLERFSEAERTELKSLKQYMMLQFLFQDPPRHTRLRGLVAKAFTPRLIEGMRARIERNALDLINGFRSKGKVDLNHEFAYPLPLFVIGDMLGVPRGDWDTLKDWSTGIAGFLNTRATIEDARRSQACALAMQTYFTDLIEVRKRAPEEDLISHLVRVEEDGDKLSHDEMLSTLMLLLIAGHETTSNLIGNGIYTLLKNPEQLRYLRNNLHLTSSAVEEILRYESPVHYTGRLATQEGIHYSGQAIPKGKRVILLNSAANRDPEVFADPDKFDIRRESKRHIAFGLGIHFCPGAPLARLEGEIALRALLENFPTLKLSEFAADWAPGALRGMKTLPVEWHREP